MNIRELLLKNQDLDYREFQAKLIPNVDKNSIMGIRVPVLRKIAKEISPEDKKKFIKKLPHKYLEENIIHGMFIESISESVEESFKYLNEFLPYVDNWVVCDTMSFRIFKKEPEKVFNQLKKWLESDGEYKVRFSVVMMLAYFINESYVSEINQLLVNLKREEYYIKMAVSWYFSYALIKEYDKTIDIFENKILDKWIHNKSIQKAIESFRISDEKKEYLKNLKIK